MEKTNIVLIGMPASGKSTAGVILAKVLGMDFIDADLVIQKKTGKRLSQLIEELGVEGFVELEDTINASIEAENTIISTGGSAVYGEREMKHFAEIGTVVYLEVPFEELDKRLSDIRGRGVVLREGQTLRDLYEERKPLYEKYADITVSEVGASVEQVVVEVAERWQESRSAKKD